MKTNIMERLYDEIGNTLSDMIPEKWTKVYVYAEVWEYYTSVYFYYYPINNEIPVYSMEIEKNFSVNRSMFRDSENKLDEYFEVLWEEFENQGQEQWSNLTFILESTGKFDIEYGYEDLSKADPVETKKQWMQKFLGVF